MSQLVMNNFDEMNSEEWNNGCFKGSFIFKCKCNVL